MGNGLKLDWAANMVLDNDMYSSVIIGAGPAGCSAAIWLQELGFSVALVDRAPDVCSTIGKFAFPQNWVLGADSCSFSDLSRDYRNHVLSASNRPGLELIPSTEVTSWAHAADGSWEVHLSSQRVLRAKSIVVATGLRPRRPVEYFSSPSERVLDAVQLTNIRSELGSGTRVLLLGGGDNAAENAIFLGEKGCLVTVVCRKWQAQSRFVNIVSGMPEIEVIKSDRMPVINSFLAADGIEMRFLDGKLRYFDFLAVLFGFEKGIAKSPALQHRSVEYGAISEDVKELGLFLAGDASGRWHPCVQTALADGVEAAKAVQRYIENGSNFRGVVLRSREIRLEKLIIPVGIGYLENEFGTLQRIQVDVSVKLYPLEVSEDDPARILDYRLLRDSVRDVCLKGHIKLVETLADRIAQRISIFSGVKGVRVRVAKVDIFDDCRVAVECEYGEL